MANPRLIKKRVGSIKNIGKITKALEMVSASKVQKAQILALNAKPYANTIYGLVGSLAGASGVKEITLMRTPKIVSSDMYIIVSTSRGLAGSLNTNLFRFAERFLQKKKGMKHSFVTLGKKGVAFAAENGKLVADFSEEKEIGSVVSALSRLVIDGFSDETYDEVYIIYSEFINALTQEPRIKKILPISKEILEEEVRHESFEILGNSGASRVLSEAEKSYSYEPDAVTVLGNLLPFYLEIQIAEAIYEGQASEHSARMVAMKNANENANELSVGLTLLYNKARQSMITTEISDITTAQLSILSQNG